MANIYSNDVTILKGIGSGGFTQAAGSPIAVGLSPSSVVASDLNGDGRQDLAVVHYNASSVSILLGKGTGGFSEAATSPVPVGANPYSAVAVDLNGDGKTDLAVTNSVSHNVTILLNGTATASNGTACNDGNVCTQTDTCQGWTCVGTNPVVCAETQCSYAGACYPGTGCLYASKPNGTLCDDGNVCTAGDSCINGSCTGTPVGPPPEVQGVRVMRTAVPPCSGTWRA